MAEPHSVESSLPHTKKNNPRLSEQKHVYCLTVVRGTDQTVTERCKSCFSSSVTLTNTLCLGYMSHLFPSTYAELVMSPLHMCCSEQQIGSNKSFVPITLKKLFLYLELKYLLHTLWLASYLLLVSSRMRD